MGSVESNNAMFFQTFSDNAIKKFKEISKSSEEMSQEEIRERITEATKFIKKYFLDEGEELNISDDIEDVTTKNLKETEESITDKIKSRADTLIKKLKSKGVGEELSNALLDKNVIHDALIKTIATKRFVGLEPKLKEFMMLYDNAVVNARHYIQLSNRFEKETVPGMVNPKVLNLKTSVTRLEDKWKKLTPEQKRVLKNEYGITQKKVLAVLKPLQDSMLERLYSVQQKIEQQISELEEESVTHKEDDQKLRAKKAAVGERLQTFLIGMKSNSAQAYRKEHWRDIFDEEDGLIKRAERLGIKVEIPI